MTEDGREFLPAQEWREGGAGSCLRRNDGGASGFLPAQE